MSIINQTLRDLDARKTDAGPAHVPTPWVSTPSRPQRVLWLAAAVLLPIVGLAIWFGLQNPPVDPSAPEDAAQAVAAPLAARVPAPLAVPEVVSAAPPTQPAVQGASAAVHEAPRLTTEMNLPKPQLMETARQPEVGTPRDLAASDQKQMGMQPTNVAKAPAISKEVKKSTPEEDAEDRYRKALTMVNKGRDNQARPMLEEALRLYPGHVAARQVLATLLSEMGLNREAEAVLLEGRAISPDVAWFALSLARLQTSRGDVEAAAATMQGGIEGRGVNAEYRATYAALLSRLKRHSEAARQYEQALKQQPDQSTWWMGLGLARAAQGQSDEARAAYGRALAAGNLSEKLEEFVRAKLAE